MHIPPVISVVLANCGRVFLVLAIAGPSCPDTASFLTLYFYTFSYENLVFLSKCVIDLLRSRSMNSSLPDQNAQLDYIWTVDLSYLTVAICARGFCA